ncbi:hypothetical protein SRABI133_04431 [Peribacillus simplex]|uniref:Uncharacterized protein n=1 Tax=Peribacillus simplex TaxID=1478 RepID=A0A9W4L850_9BACI|nr:hypothetical protein SRABI133_04431 [Peribacillus simplex]
MLALSDPLFLILSVPELTFTYFVVVFSGVTAVDPVPGFVVDRYLALTWPSFPLALIFAQPLDSEYTVTFVPFESFATMLALSDPPFLILSVPELTFTYFVVVFSGITAVDPDPGFAVDRYLVLTYPSIPLALTFAQPLDSEYTVTFVPFERIATMLAVAFPLFRILREPVLTFTYFVVVLTVTAALVTVPGFAADKYLVLTYPPFPLALIFAQPFDSEYTVTCVPFASFATMLASSAPFFLILSEPELTCTNMTSSILAFSACSGAADIFSSKATVDNTAKQKVGIINFFISFSLLKNYILNIYLNIG